MSEFFGLLKMYQKYTGQLIQVPLLKRIRARTRRYNLTIRHLRAAMHTAIRILAEKVVHILKVEYFTAGSYRS